MVDTVNLGDLMALENLTNDIYHSSLQFLERDFLLVSTEEFSKESKYCFHIPMLFLLPVTLLTVVNSCSNTASIIIHMFYFLPKLHVIMLK